MVNWLHINKGSGQISYMRDCVCKHQLSWFFKDPSKDSRTFSRLLWFHSSEHVSLIYRKREARRQFLTTKVDLQMYYIPVSDQPSSPAKVSFRNRNKEFCSKTSKLTP